MKMTQKFKHLLTTTLLIGATFLITSCSKKEVSTEKVLNIAVSAEIKGMDPIYADDKYSSNEVARIYEGLLEYHYLKRPYTLVPNLAAELPVVSADGLTYTFKIKPGVFFQDNAAFESGKGRELVAEDFVYSIKRLADPKLQGLGWWLLEGKIKGLDAWREKYASKDAVDYDEKVEGLFAADKYTLVFVLAKPFPQFLYSLAMPFTFAVSREVVEKYGKEFLNHPVGTGAYMLESFSPSSKRIEYTKNPNFRKKLFPSEGSEEFKSMLVDAGKELPFAEKVVINVITESQPRWLNFRKGKLDYSVVDKDNFDSVVKAGNKLAPELSEKGINLDISASLDVTYTAFNHDLELFKNIDLRRALSLAVDTHESNKLFYNNTALPAQSVIPPGIAGYMKDYKSPYGERDLARAKEYLAKAGYPDGKGLPVITYDCPSSSTSRQIGELFKKHMSDIGVNIQVNQNTWPELQKKINTRQVMLFGIAWGADYPDAENFLQLLYGPNKSPGSNGSGFNNPVFNQLFEKSSVMQDSPERTALYEKLNRMAAEELPWMYGVHRQNYTVKHNWLKNYISTDFEAGQAQYLNIDLEEKNKSIEKL